MHPLRNSLALSPVYLCGSLGCLSGRIPWSQVAHLDHSKAERLLGLKFHSPKQALIDELHAIIAMGGVKAKT